MKKFVNAEVIELSLKATAQADPNPTGLDAQWADRDAREIDMDSIQKGIPFPSGDEEGIHINMPR